MRQCSPALKAAPGNESLYDLVASTYFDFCTADVVLP